MARTLVVPQPGDLGKWLALAAALAALGFLPKGWQKALGAAAAVVALLRQ